MMAEKAPPSHILLYFVEPWRWRDAPSSEAAAHQCLSVQPLGQKIDWLLTKWSETRQVSSIPSHSVGGAKRSSHPFLHLLPRILPRISSSSWSTTLPSTGSLSDRFCTFMSPSSTCLTQQPPAVSFFYHLFFSCVEMLLVSTHTLDWMLCLPNTVTGSHSEKHQQAAS